MQVLNCLGEACPIPLLHAREVSDKLKIGESFRVVIDHSCALEAMQDYYLERHYQFVIHEVINGVWEVTIIKQDPPAPESAENTDPGFE